VAASGAFGAIDYLFSAELPISAFCEAKRCYLDSQKGSTVTNFLRPSSMNVALLVCLLFLGTIPRTATADCDSPGLSDTGGSQIMVPTGGSKDEPVEV